MEDQEEQGGAVAAGSWTCEACGCHSNTELANPQSCGICGILRRDGSVLRRGGVSAASRFLSRAHALRRGMNRDDNPFDDDGLHMMDHFDEEDVMMEDEEAMAALALGVAGIRRGSRTDMVHGGRLMRAMEPRMRQAAAPPRNLPRPEDLMLKATQNAASYPETTWAHASQLGGRMQSESVFELGPGELANVALAPVGSGEGRTVRAMHPLPRHPVAIGEQGPTPQSETSASNKVFGFKVSFQGPRPQVGASMGGCYLVGVAMSSFTAFGERNGLQQSPYFWGIEDGGSKFEGPASRQRGRSSSTFGIEIGRGEVPFNDSDMLFGSQEVLTVVCDMEHRTLTYWRNERFLGTLVTNLPRTGLLYPVAVPFNSGVSVAITDIHGDPRESLQQFEAYWMDEHMRQIKRQRKAISELRSVYIANGMASPGLVIVLKKIFASYVAPNGENLDDSHLVLESVDASRLWYRCGIRLGRLQSLMEARGIRNSTSGDFSVSCRDFVSCIEELIEADEQEWGRIDTGTLSHDNFMLKIGDVVELVEGFTKYGDATDGPLKLGERGIVIELKEGSIGQKHVRVFFSGQTWWYRAHALLTERSQLVDSAVVWFLRRMVRAHGYRSTNLEPMWGEPVSASSCQVGDIVVPKRTDQDDSALPCNSDYCFGRVAASQTSSLSHGRRTRDIGIVQVEFIDPSFGVLTGVFNSSRLGSAPSHHARQIRAQKLVHGRNCLYRLNSGNGSRDGVGEAEAVDPTYVSPQVVKDSIIGLEVLDVTAIERVTEECRKNIFSLSAMFDAGLSDKILNAVERAKTMLQSGREISVPLLALNILLRAIAYRVFPDEKISIDGDSIPNPSSEAAKSPPRTRSRVERSGRSDDALSRRNGRSMMSRLSSRSRVNSIDSQDSGLNFGTDSRVAVVHHANDFPPLCPFRDVTSTLSNSLRGRDFPSFDIDDYKDDGPLQLSKGSSVDCLLLDSLPWLKSSLESTPSTGSGILDVDESCKICDEDGMPLLLLAIRFGCSQDVINFLIQSGSSVGVKEIIAAALTNQSETLGILLRNWIHSEEAIDTSAWPKEARAVYVKAEAYRSLQEKKVQEDGTKLVTALILKLCHLGHLCHRMRSTEAGECLRAVTEALVGNPLLRVLSRAQETALSSNKSQASSRFSSASGREVERVSLSCANSSDKDSFTTTTYGPVSLSHGLLQIAPEDVFRKLLSRDASVDGSTDPRSALLSFIESFLWSQECADIAVGLSSLHRLLKCAPLAEMSGELDRYGMKDMVSRHRTLAERALSDIQVRKLLLASSSESSTAGPSTEENKANCPGAMFCPKHHVAEFHVTKHSSFRCDICGKGVDRGMPMHGCRSCDWDACEACTDKAEGGIAKWGHVLELASACELVLSTNTSENEQGELDLEAYNSCVNAISVCDVKELATRIRGRNLDALAELRDRLASPGLTAIHEFASFILPSLYESLLQDCKILVENNGNKTPTRQTKKQRTRGSFRNDDGATKWRINRKDSDREAFSRAVFEELLGFSTDAMLPSDRPESMAEQVFNAMAVEELEEGIGRDRDPTCTNSVPEVIYLLHQILSFSERVDVFFSVDRGAGCSSRAEYSSLATLTEPIELELSNWHPDEFEGSKHASSTVVLAEPLTPLSDLRLHVLRACRIDDETYVAYCKRIVSSKSVIVIRPKRSAHQADTKNWQVARVLSYSENTGAHTIQYMTSFAEMALSTERVVLRRSGSSILDRFRFGGSETALVLACRDYYIVGHDANGVCHPQSKVPSSAPSSPDFLVESEGAAARSAPTLAGRRAETTAGSADGSTWLPCTILNERQEREPESTTRTRRSRIVDTYHTVYDVVTDDGEVYCKIAQQQIRVNRPHVLKENERDGVNFSVSDRSGNILARSMFPFFGGRRNGLESDSDGPGHFHYRPGSQVGILKRTWSAVSPLQDLSSVDLKLEESEPDLPRDLHCAHQWNCCLGSTTFSLSAEAAMVQIQPRLDVHFGTRDVLPSPTAECVEEETLFSTLCRLRRRSHQDRLAFCQELRNRQNLFYSISLANSGGDTLMPSKRVSESLLPFSLPTRPTVMEKLQSHRPFCGEFDLACMQSMEILNKMARHAQKESIMDERHPLRADLRLGLFQSETLTKKLTEQLDDSLVVVGSVVPDWAVLGPAFAPGVFSYESRRLLLDRTAFGMSRAVLRQQEAKVAVGPLRKRMAVLRARAVELVGEAFSGGAEDPTALQLQADELYGMEEALAVRVQSAFRAQRWRERSLQCAKVSVNRETLLVDAAIVMDRYAGDNAVRRRRLEVRFEGESGFDAASGDEAGVTRGFYADVAEALLSADHIAPLHFSAGFSSCPDGFASTSSGLDCDIKMVEETKLPLWIPDMDSSRHVVIPTPRADPGSTIGVFPRPLSPFDARLPLVIQQFRLMGRLFAAALRDSFMFPLPFSCSFLKLVQHVGTDDGVVAHIENPRTLHASSSEIHLNQKLPPRPTASNALSFQMNRSPLSEAISDSGVRLKLDTLHSADLPRPGFLGGEVFAVEAYICEALNRLDAADPPLSKAEVEKRRKDVASDRSFARVALGKSFDCSFEEYFEDRTFVDPLDSSQGEEAYRLCPDGHLRPVTVDNVREWVCLAKDFVLFDGIVEQARAFRRGVEDFFPADYLSVLSPEELQRDVCGSGDNVDRWDEKAIRDLFKLDGGTEALVAVAAIGGESGASLSRRFGQSSPTIGYLIKTLLESSPTQRRQFLSFVTSVPIVTPGKLEVIPMISAAGKFMPMNDPTCLPRANTCARRLYLPKFENYESFARVLHAVIREESKFKGFYEWRG